MEPNILGFILKRSGKIIWVVIFSSLILFQAFHVSVAASNKEVVIVLHGIARSSSSMATLAEHLETHGYQVFNIDYPSTDHNIMALVDLVHQKITELKINPTTKTHFVGYSMGCLITRGIIHRYRPQNLGRVVMLGPPNRGSEVAEFFKEFFLYEKIYGPAGQELGTGHHDYSELLGRVNYELGVIAGDRSIDPISSTIIPGPDDGKVAVTRTRLQGMKDHIVVHATHTFMMRNTEVLMQTAHFLKMGEFQRSVKP